MAATPENCRWRRVRGPMGATICTLLASGWNPAQPEIWMDPQGNVAFVHDKNRLADIEEHFRNVMKEEGWKRAAHHWAGMTWRKDRRISQ